MIPTKEQLDSKWWHRFFKVILIASTVIVFFVLTAFMGNNGGFDWQKSKYLYSFENNYNKYTGTEQSCFYYNIYGNPIGVAVPAGQWNKTVIAKSLTCGNLAKYEFISKYCESRPMESVCKKEEQIGSKPSIMLVDEILAKYANGDSDIEKIINSEGVKSKLIYYWDWKVIIRDIFVLIAIVIGWIGLLKYGIYKAILYIVYGRN